MSLEKTPWITKMWENICADVQSKTGIQVHYEHGSRQNIDEVLAAWTKNPDNSKVKYPLIGLIQPFTEKKSAIIGTESEVTFKLVIANFTDPGYTPDQREANNFVPVLRPIYRQLIESILKSGYFAGSPYEKLTPDITDLYEWGEKGGSVFCDYIDVIFIENLKLSIKEFNCS
jgi:hypothetical protein